MRTNKTGKDQTLYAWVAPCEVVAKRFNITDCVSKDLARIGADYLYMKSYTYTKIPSGN